ALRLAVARFAGAVRAVDAGLAPLAAHAAAEVAEVGHAELDERGHRHGTAVGRGEVPDHRAPAAPHAERVTGAERRALRERQQAGHARSGRWETASRASSIRREPICCPWLIQLPSRAPAAHASSEFSASCYPARPGGPSSFLSGIARARKPRAARPS